MPSLCSRLALLIVAGLTACSDFASTDPTTPEPELTALVVGEAASPFIDILTERTHTVQDDGSQKVADHDLIIFDGDTHTPAALAEHPRIAEVMKEGVWVLVADASEAHKQEGTEPLLGFSSQGDTDAHLFRSVPGDLPVFDILQMPPTSIKEPVGEPFSDDLKAELKERQHRKFVERVVARVGGGTASQQGGGCSSPLSIPAGILYATWCYSNPLDWDMTWASNTGNINDTSDWVVKAGNPWSDGRVTEPQAGQNDPNYTLTLLLNNQAEATGNSQSLHVAIEGQMTPTTTTWPSGYEDYLTGAPYLIGDWLLVYGIPEPVYAWPQSQLDLGMAPFQDASNVLKPAANFAPQTPNNSETFSYTSSTSLTIGATLNAGATPTGPTGGGSVSGSYRVSSSNTRSKTITDWTWLAAATEPIGQTSGGYSWTFKSQNPPVGTSTPGEPWDRGWSTSPNQLIRNLMAYSAEAVWTTSEVSDEKLGFALSSVQTLPSLSEEAELLPFFTTQQLQGGTDYVRLDLGTVIPVTLEPTSLTFTDSAGNAITKDNPALAGDTVTGTVALTGPAPFSYSITSTATSLNDNAVITESPVRITKGDTSKTFTIETNENGLTILNETVAVDVFLGSFGSTAAQQLWIVND